MRPLSVRPPINSEPVCVLWRTGSFDDRQTAEECENDTYMQAWNLIPPHEPADYLYAFLARITRHLSSKLLQKTQPAEAQRVVSALSARRWSNASRLRTIWSAA